MGTPIDQREKNRAKQRRYRENLKHSDSGRLAVTVKKETLDRIREIARKSKITQGEVLDRIFKGGIAMNQGTMEAAKTEPDVVKTTVDRFQFEDFNLSEIAIDVIARMLGFNTKDAMEEEERTTPDTKRLKFLAAERNQFLNEQRLIYRGNKKIMRACIDQYSPIIRARYEENDG